MGPLVFSLTIAKVGQAVILRVSITLSYKAPDKFVVVCRGDSTL